jgi:phosphate transport system protein
VSRHEFDTELRAIRDALVDMIATATDAIHQATAALLELDRNAIDQVEQAEHRIEYMRLSVERRTYSLLALQQPVAGDLRELVSAIKIGADAHRMGSLAHHIAKAASRSHPLRAVPLQLNRTFERMGAVAGRLADGAAFTLRSGDAADAARLAIDDDAMDGLRRALFRKLLGEWPHGVEAAVNVALVGRYYERFADHAVSIAQSVVYIVAGVLPDEHAERLT